VFSHTVDLLAHHTFLVLFTFLFFCIALCTSGEKSAGGVGEQILHDQSATMFSVVLKSLYQFGTTMMYSLAGQLLHNI